MTLFLMDIHPVNRTLRWVRAGHEPALLYSATPERVEWLHGGGGVALGVCEDAVYTESMNRFLECGQVVLIGTDGIVETLHPSGEIFGRERLARIVRENHRRAAAGILEAVMAAVDAYRGPATRQDDTTLVVVKIQEPSKPS
jgi:sigma-B regulation protein RsbU (phosphoserine phosphatase)